MKKMFLFAILFSLAANSYGNYSTWGSLLNGELYATVPVPNPKYTGPFYMENTLDSSFTNKYVRCAIKLKTTNVKAGTYVIFIITRDSKGILLREEKVKLPIDNDWQTYYMTTKTPISSKATKVTCGLNLHGSGRIRTKGYYLYPLNSRSGK